MFDKIIGSKQFRGELQELLLRAQDEAADRGAPAVEAEHLLLAMAAVPFGQASRVLQALGVSRDSIAQALDRERTSALAVVGVETRGLPHPQPVRDSRRHLWGPSARLAAERSTKEDSADTQLRILLGIVHAEAGVIPRLLAELGLTTSDVEETARTR